MGLLRTLVSDSCLCKMDSVFGIIASAMSAASRLNTKQAMKGSAWLMLNSNVPVSGPTAHPRPTDSA